MSASLPSAFGALAPWSPTGDLSADEWDRYLEVARAVQATEPDEVERALSEFLDGASPEDETRLFLLLRVVFDLPERGPADERRTYKGFVNWPEPDADGDVDLSWPVGWRDGRPFLSAPYEGSEGPRYAALEEYRHLREQYPSRALPAA